MGWVFIGRKHESLVNGSRLPQGISSISGGGRYGKAGGVVLPTTQS